MSKENFIELVNSFCTIAKLSPPEKLLEGNAIEVDGVDFYLGYDEELAPEHVIVYCDFGTPPENKLLDAYQALLEANMVVYGSNSPSFMLSPGKRVALAYQYQLDQVVAEQLMALCINLATQAKQWQLHHFLDIAA